MAVNESLSLFEYFLRRWWPSTAVRRDPLGAAFPDARYRPAAVRALKLTPWMRRKVLQNRTVKPLLFDATQRLTVIIPFRDRDEHLVQLIPALRAQLRAQSIQHRILVVEQEQGQLFNRGKLINVGVHRAADRSDYFCLHDVDAIPEVANYACPSQPLRLVTHVITPQGVERRPDHYFSGAVSVRKEQYIAANGYSNEYWGWGKEDDDLFFRLILSGFVCYIDDQGRFHDLPNPRSQQVPRRPLLRPPHVRRNRQRRSKLFRGLTEPAQDGLSTLRYELLEVVSTEDYERIRVRV